MSTVIDWASKQEPWCWIGPAFKAEVEAIASTQLPWWQEFARRRRASGVSAHAVAQAIGASGHGEIYSMEHGERSKRPVWADALDAFLSARGF